MRSDKIYVPVLKGKLAEVLALSNVPIPHRNMILPLVEVIAEDSEDPVSVEAGIDTLVSRIAPAWPGADILLDANWVADAGALSSGALAITQLHALARAAALHAVPVVWLTSDASIIGEAAAIAKQDGRGACIRLRLADMDNIGVLGTTLATTAAQLGLPPDGIDLVVDFAAVDESNANALGAIAAIVLPTLPHLADWRSMTLVSGAFPKNLDAYSAYTPGPAPRWDKQLWLRVRAAGLPRTPTFGDYAVAHPDAPTSGGFAPAPNLRYALDTEWLILKGKKGTPRGNRDFMDICAQMLAPNPNPFGGQHFSWGDQEIERCSRSVGGPGGAKEWRAWAASHHLAFVIDRLATTGAP